DVAEDHECGGAPLPALADVRAVRLLADGVEVVRLDGLLEPAVGGAARRRDLEPRGLARVEGDFALVVCDPPARIGAGTGDVQADLVGLGHRSYRTGAVSAAREARRSPAGTGSRSKISPNRRATISIYEPRSNCAPSSRVTEVMRTVSIPAGTIHSNGREALVTFAADPWVGTPPVCGTPLQ